MVTDRQYGEHVGVFHSLDLFAREGITTTFFINGMTAEIHPESMRSGLEASSAETEVLRT